MSKECEPLNRETRPRMLDEVVVAAYFFRLGLCALIHILKWPDWQLGFKVSGPIGPSIVYLRFAPGARETLETLLNPKDADAWNQSFADNPVPSDIARDVFTTAEEQRERGLV